MTKPLNIYTLSRIKEESEFNILAKHETGNPNLKKIQKHEIRSLFRFVSSVVSEGLSVADLDGFFYTYQIPQLSKEFDLLKLDSSYCINIELKSKAVPQEQILKQLVQNNYYLKATGRRLFLYSVITDTMTCYMLSSGTLVRVEIEEIATSIKGMSYETTKCLDDLFKPSSFLVSPLNDPEKFLRGEYFLTDNQEQIKNSILKTIDSVNGTAFFYISGKPGTGKTLLLYDIAKSISATRKVLIIHCGKMTEGQRIINRNLQEIDIVVPKELNYYDISEYDVVIIDEAQRIYRNQFEGIIESVNKTKQICILSSDPGQILSEYEKKSNINEKIQQLNLSGEYELSHRIRTNYELHSFIMSLKDLHHKPKKQVDYSGVDINYASSIAEARSIIEYYRKKGFEFINYTKSIYVHSPFSIYDEDYDTHHVIGQEFDNVVMLLDDTFYYDSDGKLCGKEHPNPDYLYPNLLYQGITRVREHLALIILNNKSLFDGILSIIDKQ